jgi:hypothetical protein
MLKILATLPVSSCEPERIFSKVEHTMTAIRASMAEERLEALILLPAPVAVLAQKFWGAQPPGRPSLPLPFSCLLSLFIPSPFPLFYSPSPPIPLPFLPFPLPLPLFLPSHSLPFEGGSGGITPGKIFRIKDARRWALEHFGDNKQHLYEPGFLTVTFEFQINFSILAAENVYACD